MDVSAGLRLSGGGAWEAQRAGQRLSADTHTRTHGLGLRGVPLTAPGCVGGLGGGSGMGSQVFAGSGALSSASGLSRLCWTRVYRSEAAELRS